VVAILLAECLLALLGAGEVGHGEDRLTWLAVWLCGMMMLLADLAALYAVGLWQSAVAKAPAQAAGAAAFRILALPWILYMLLLAAMAVVDGLNLVRGLPNPSWVFWLLSWVCIGCGVNLVFGVKAWHDIHTRFRQVAAQPSMDGGWGGRLGRLFARMTAQRNAVR
jgi:hypothetical protein